MPAGSRRDYLAALCGYLCVAVVFSWPLPLHLSTALPGPVSGDTGVYVWNLWVFRHEIVAHHRLPFFTLEILSLTPGVPLALHNYTTFANILAFPLLPWLGTVATFNLLLIGSGALSAFAMFAWARRCVGDSAAAWVAGLAFGFAPFMSARATEHFSLVQTAPLPIFALLFAHLHRHPSARVAAAAGATVAWAFLCDPYYAVYCLLIAFFSIGYSAVAVAPGPSVTRPYGYRAAVDIALVCLAGLIIGIVLRGGGRIEFMGVRVSMTRLYTPVLLFTVLSLIRLWSVVGARVRWTFPATLPSARLVMTAGLAGLVLLSPILTALSSATAERQWANPHVWWRSSAAGLDVLSFLLPNPMHPWLRDRFAAGLASMPGGVVENVGSIPFTLLVVIAAAVVLARTRMPRYWIAFSAFFAILALGPFIQIAGRMTHIPTPWALLRYLPVVGAARMPPRMIVLVTLGLAMLLAYALRDLRGWAGRRTLLTVAVTAVLLLELLPSPRALHPVRVAWFYQTIAADPRPVKVMDLPFGLRDGLSTMGNTTAANQFYQTFHEKQLVGGYMSRLPARGVDAYRRRRLTRALMDLSEGLTLTDEQRNDIIASARETLPELNIGYVIVDTDRASAELVAFAREAFDLTLVGSEHNRMLYRTPLASPSAK